MVDLLLALQNGGQQPTAAEAAGIIAFVVAMFVTMLVISLGISILICLLIYLGYKPVPEQYQKLSPGLVFLLLIPFFNLYWNFVVFLQIPDSYKAYFDAHGRTEFGDCGRGIGKWYAICALCMLVPCLNYIAGPAALVLFIIFLVKIYSMKGALGSSAPVTPPV